MLNNCPLPSELSVAHLIPVAEKGEGKSRGRLGSTCTTHRRVFHPDLSQDENWNSKQSWELGGKGRMWEVMGNWPSCLQKEPHQFQQQWTAWLPTVGKGREHLIFSLISLSLPHEYEEGFMAEFSTFLNSHICQRQAAHESQPRQAKSVFYLVGHLRSRAEVVDWGSQALVPCTDNTEWASSFRWSEAHAKCIRCGNLSSLAKQGSNDKWSQFTPSYPPLSVNKAERVVGAVSEKGQLVWEARSKACVSNRGEKTCAWDTRALLPVCFAH